MGSISTMTHFGPEERLDVDVTKHQGDKPNTTHVVTIETTDVSHILFFTGIEHLTDFTAKFANAIAKFTLHELKECK